MERKNTKVCVVSYKRPDNNTCKLLLDTQINWQVYVYEFDPFIDDYFKAYGNHVRVIITDEISKANLPKKRQLVLDDCVRMRFANCIMLDDDINSIQEIDAYNSDNLSNINILQALEKMTRIASENTEYIALSASYNISSNKDASLEIEDYKNVCNNSIFNLELYEKARDIFMIKYNPDSKCEDMEFTVELLEKGYKTGRIKLLLMHNVLQGGTTNDGLSYRFSGKNRFVEEGQYMQERFPKYKDAFEYDEKHFKMNSETLKKLLESEKL